MLQFNPALLLSELKLGANELRRNRSPWDVVNARRALQIIKRFRFCFISSLISRLNTCVVQLMVKALKCPHSAPLICMLTYEKSHSRTGIRLKKLCTFFLSELCLLISCTFFSCPPLRTLLCIKEIFIRFYPAAVAPQQVQTQVNRLPKGRRKFYRIRGRKSGFTVWLYNMSKYKQSPRGC